MMDQPNGLQTLADRYGVSLDAVRHLIRALEAGHGTMAQFNHPDLGGFGQWSAGGMTMIGDMFNSGLKARVDGLCTDLARSLPALGWVDHPSDRSDWWPAEFGHPSTAGAQNGMRYAYFPKIRRLAVDADGTVSIYDTADHDISGVSQQQGDRQSLRFSGRDGAIDLETLRRIDDRAAAAPAQPSAPLPEANAAPIHEAGATEVDILATIERLAELQRKGILTEAEFAGKKAELLARL